MTHHCPSCSKLYKLAYFKSRSYICPSCGVAVNIEDNSFVTTVQNPKIMPLSPFTIGKNGHIRGIHYTIIGFLAYSGIDESWMTEEWILHSTQGTHMLEYDFYDKKYYLYIPVSSQEQAEITSRLKVDESYESRLQQAGGEFPYLIKVPDTVHIREGVYQTMYYTEERDEVDTELYKKVTIPENEILEGFRLDQSTSGKIQKAIPVQKSDRKRGGVCVFISIFMGLFLCIFSFIPGIFAPRCEPAPPATSGTGSSLLTPTPTDRNCRNSTRGIWGRSFTGGGSGGK